MNEIDFIVSQLEHAFDGDPWHGPSLMNVLNGVTATQAAARPVAGAHNIWELVLHVTAWKKAVAGRMKGTAIELQGEADLPPVTSQNENAWKAALSDLRVSHENLKREVSGMPAAHLENAVPNRPYPLRFMLYGVIQHEAYHAGQMALLKKDI